MKSSVKSKGQNTIFCKNNQSLIKNSSQKYSNIQSIMLVLIAIADLLIIFLGGVLMFYLHPELEHAAFTHYVPIIGIITVSILMTFYFEDLYSHDLKRYYKSLVKKILLISSLVFLVLITIIFAFKVSEQFSRIWIFSWYLFTTAFLCIEREWVRLVLNKLHKKGTLGKPIAIIGSDEKSTRMLTSLAKQKSTWMHIAIFDDRINRFADNSDHPIVGNIDDLIEHVRAHRIDEVLVALPGQAEQRTLKILKQLEGLPIRVRLCPDQIGFNFPDSNYSNYAGIPVMNIYDKPIDGWNSIFKSIEDKVLAMLALILVFPVLLVVMLLVKLDSKGPIFFRQKRYGFNNQLIEVLKFRTMYIDSQDGNAEKLVTRNDPRVTRIGNVLRRTSLDELPQILNVLRGEMSLVGPRPHATKAKAAGRYYQDVVSEYAYRHKVKPGISGWAQVQGWRGETDTEEKIIKRVEHDMHYIDNWSLSFDIYILAKTIVVLFRSEENAY